MVQVASIDEQAATGEPQTIRAWVLSQGRIRALDGAILRQNFEIAGLNVDETAPVSFETGWLVTGAPGGQKVSDPVRRQARHRAVAAA